MKKNRWQNISELYIILDFSASKRFSHDWYYVKLFKDFLSINNSINTICWIPKNADADISKSLGEESCYNLLRSPMYGYTKRENFLYWLCDFLISQILRSEKVNSNHFLAERLKNLFSKIYIRAPLLQLAKLKKEYKKISIVVPTTDPLALRFLISAHNRKILDAAHLRFLGGENRGPFFFNDENQMLQKINQEFSELYLGCETLPYIDFLKNRTEDRISVVWSPVPTSQGKTKVKIKVQDKSKIKLGFLGSARPNKGFHQIPGLLDALSKQKIKFEATIQLAVFPWDDYITTLKILETSFHSSVKYLNSNLSQEELEDSFNDIDILVLPYTLEYYDKAGSGLLFSAADRNIPIIATAKLAFEWDLKNFNIGGTYENLDEFTNLVRLYAFYSDGAFFNTYNNARNHAVKKFLGISEVKERDIKLK